MGFNLECNVLRGTYLGKMYVWRICTQTNISNNRTQKPNNRQHKRTAMINSCVSSCVRYSLFSPYSDMRSPSCLGLALVAVSSVGLLLPVLLFFIQLLGIILSFMSSSQDDNKQEPQSITLKMLYLMIPSFRGRYDALSDVSEVSTLQIVTRHSLYIINTLSSLISRIPQFIASGLLCYVGICIGYVGVMHLREK